MALATFVFSVAGDGKEKEERKLELSPWWIWCWNREDDRAMLLEGEEVKLGVLRASTRCSHASSAPEDCRRRPSLSLSVSGQLEKRDRGRASQRGWQVGPDRGAVAFVVLLFLHLSLPLNAEPPVEAWGKTSQASRPPSMGATHKAMTVVVGITRSQASGMAGSSEEEDDIEQSEDKSERGIVLGLRRICRLGEGRSSGWS
uniref:Uncharacterized protein n=1 Tax=Oryza punctata TaxID=4537 RepID=A0A0E0JM81_ORYPU